VGFYAQAARGQYQLLAHQRPVQKLVTDPATPASLKSQLELFEKLRAFADKELKLPVNGYYRKYVDLHRKYVVWNVEAAPELSLEAKTWWYPVAGSLSYRGYFSERGATNYAACLRKKGYDAYVGGVEAYSTLGWFKDPVLNTFLFDPEPDLAETLFHELGHQRVFAHGDTDFNEAFATSVGEEGARRWLRAKGDTAAYEKYVARLANTRQFASLIKDTRKQLEEADGDTETEEGSVKAGPKKSGPAIEEARREKQRVLERLKQEYAALKSGWGGDTEYDEWFSRPINNAQLNSVATYYDLVPSFERLLAANGGDLEKFYQAVERLANMPEKKRRTELRRQSE
jgi:predicted aminopeptidase